MKTTKAHDERIARMTFASVYPHYVAKVEKKGRTVDELHQVISWLTGFNVKDLRRLIVGVAQGFGASLPEPGHAHHNDMKAIRMGAYDGLSASQVMDIAALWRDAGFDAADVDDILAMQWEKLICNVAYSAPCAVTGLTVGAVMDHPQLGAVSRAAATEAWTVARARQVAIAVDDPVALVREFAGRMPDAKPSVFLDIEAGRISEVDVINGAVPREGKLVGVDAPVNAALTTLVQTLEGRRGKEQP